MPKRTDIIPEITEKMSPMMRQYVELKRQNPDSILFFRLGDFYEMFFNDAKIASEELDLTLTKRASGEDDKAPMCGVPYHSCESYISRLIKKGYRVSVCEQTEDPSKTKKLVSREVVRVITPGTVMNEAMLETSKNNYLATVYFDGTNASCCFVDISTSELNLTTLDPTDAPLSIINELTKFQPRELLITTLAYEEKRIRSFLKTNQTCRIETMEAEKFSNQEKFDYTLNHFKVDDFPKINVDEFAKHSLSCALYFLAQTQKQDLSSLNKINVYGSDQYMKLDAIARTNLELTHTMRGNNKKGTLLWVMDKTNTPMGKRLINNWVEMPLVSIPEITRRQNAVLELVSDIETRDKIIDLLRNVRDIERLVTRIIYKTVNAKELISLRSTLANMPHLKRLTGGFNCEMLQTVNKEIDELSDVYTLLEEALDDDPPTVLREGKLIRRGYDEEIDRNYNDMTNGKDIVRQIENRERERTGVKKLTVKYNRVFGYYIDIPASATNFVKPDDYVRRQTLANSERYVTDEVRELEGRILGAQDRLYALEYQMFCKIRDAVALQSERIRKTANAIARLDAIISLATVAYENSYVCPQIATDGVIEIYGGRHPVVEKLCDDAFVPNDTYLDSKEDRCAIITGPNMAGKSTYMRQVAIITLMAHIGSFVPAQSAKISLTDAIFTRVGASDDLAMGQSTFMVEMSEVASILNKATSNSLLIIDEVGRGTSTYDGMSIARAVLEFIADKKKIGAKTLFATHYHELTVLENTLKGVKNYNIAAKKRGDDLVFLRKIVKGGADESYGIEVAKLAGVPNEVVNRAKRILNSIENKQPEGFMDIAKVQIDEPQDNQITFASDAKESIIKDLKTIDVNNLTPMEAMQRMYELVEKVKNI